jgi:5-methylthioadenosine/S-adenosylhomocysteine deaminase
MCELCRRAFLGGFGALGATGFIPSSFAQTGSTDRFDASPVPLPPRPEFIIKNAHIMTMDPQLGDIPGGSVHVRDGEIVAVGANIEAPADKSRSTAKIQLCFPGL